MEDLNEKFLPLTGKSQGMSVELYRKMSVIPKLDNYMRDQLLHMASRLYGNANDLLESENNMERLCHLKLMYSEIVQLNNLILMCFQLGMLNSDICIEFGQRLEMMRTELKTNVQIQDEIVRKDFKIGFEDDDDDLFQ